MNIFTSEEIHAELLETYETCARTGQMTVTNKNSEVRWFGGECGFRVSDGRGDFVFGMFVEGVAHYKVPATAIDDRNVYGVYYPNCGVESGMDCVLTADLLFISKKVAYSSDLFYFNMDIGSELIRIINK